MPVQNRLFGEIAKLRKDVVKPSAQFESMPYLGLDHFKLGGGLHSVGVATEAAGDKYGFSRGHTLYGRLRPYFRKTTQAAFDGYCSTEIWVIEPIDENVLDPDYLPYVVHNPDFTDFAMSGAQGTKMPRAIWEHVSRFRVRLPPVDVQKRHAQVLRSMVELAERNDQTADKLESLAVLEIEAANLPLVPLASFASSPPKKSKVLGGGIVAHFSLPAFDVKRLPDYVDASEIKSGKVPLTEPTVLVSRLNPKTPRIWMAYPDQTVVNGASTEFVLIQGAGIQHEVIWALCASPTFSKRLLELVTGTTGSHQRVDKNEILKVEVPDVRRLSPESLTAIANLVTSAYELRAEAHSVIQVKNQLQQDLLTGMLTISDGKET
jgi:type I restriction enzyme S subunit